MNMKLGLKQKRFFKKYGFLLIPNILSSDEIKLLNVDSKFLLKNESQTLYKNNQGTGQTILPTNTKELCELELLVPLCIQIA